MSASHCAEGGQARGLVLLVAVHRNDPVVAAEISPLEHVTHRATVAAIVSVTNDFDGMFGQQRRRAVGGSIVDDHDVAVELRGVSRHLQQHALDGFLFVEHGDRDEDAWSRGGHSASLTVKISALAPLQRAR